MRSFTQILELGVKKTITSSNERISTKLEKIISIVTQSLVAKIGVLNGQSALISAFDPKNVLAKGYSIVRYKGKLLESQELTKEDRLDIETKDRRITATYLTEMKSWTESLMKKLQRIRRNTFRNKR